MDDENSLLAQASPLLETVGFGYAVGTVSLMVRDALAVARELPEGLHEPSKLRDLRAQAIVPRISRSVVRGGWFGAIAGLAHVGAAALDRTSTHTDRSRGLPLNFAVSGAAVSSLAAFTAYPGHRVQSAFLGAALGAAVFYSYGVQQGIRRTDAELRRNEAQQAALDEARRKSEQEASTMDSAQGKASESEEGGTRELKPWELPPGERKAGWNFFGIDELGGGMSLGAYVIVALYGISRYMKFRKNRLGIEKR